MTDDGLAFETRVMIPPDTEAWADLVPELPLRSELLAATMVLQPHRQYVLLAYRGSLGGGRDHNRKSQQRVSLSVTQAQALLSKAYPQNKRASALSEFIITSEVEMSQFSPESIIKGFVTTTRKRHLIGEIDPGSSFVRTQCSSSFAHGEVSMFPVRELSCQKCRKYAGLPDVASG